MELLDNYTNLRNQIFEYFEYVEDWRILPLDDSTEYYWQLTVESYGDVVRFAETREQLEDKDAGDYYSNSVYTQCHLQKWVYRGEAYTMICVDTNVDGNKLLQIFKNDLEVI